MDEARASQSMPWSKKWENRQCRPPLSFFIETGKCPVLPDLYARLLGTEHPIAIL
jgi:hypothetical protein